MLTDKLAHRLIRWLKRGHYVTTACDAVGISRDTFYKWQELGKQGKEPYAALLRGIAEAAADADDRDIEVIRAASMGQWQAAAWRLERRHPSQWGHRRQQQAIVAQASAMALPPGTSREDALAIAKAYVATLEAAPTEDGGE